MSRYFIKPTLYHRHVYCVYGVRMALWSCVCVSVGMRVYICVCIRVWRPEADVGCPPSLHGTFTVTCSHGCLSSKPSAGQCYLDKGGNAMMEQAGPGSLCFLCAQRNSYFKIKYVQPPVLPPVTPRPHQPQQSHHCHTIPNTAFS